METVIPLRVTMETVILIKDTVETMIRPRVGNRDYHKLFIQDSCIKTRLLRVEKSHSQE